ncbi:MAG: hypothetical protein JOZ41_13110 [Chloroflexi bacterium]|nr:hypothetical protein [Chloroflexota bacterium]
MPATTDDHCQTAQRPAGPYHVPPEMWSAEADLTEEIRLMRRMLGLLSADLPANHRSIVALLGVLIRAVTVQATKLSGGNDVELRLQEAAERALERAMSREP